MNIISLGFKSGNNKSVSLMAQLESHQANEGPLKITWKGIWKDLDEENQSGRIYSCEQFEGIVAFPEHGEWGFLR